MDSVWSNFFWHGPNLKKKYHMASWDLLASPKRAGGLGFTNTRVMNKCLLAKWFFKIESGEDNICYNLLRKKYLVIGVFSIVKELTVPNFGRVCKM
jgi:hypothetical protein